MALIEVDTNPTDRTLRQFAGLALPVAGLIVAVVLGWRMGHPVAAAVVVVGVTLVAVWGLVHPALVRPLYVGWMYAAYPLGWVVGHLVIGVIFFLVLTPIGWGMRLWGRDPLHRKLEPQHETYWQRRDMPSDRSRYFRQF